MAASHSLNEEIKLEMSDQDQLADQLYQLTKEKNEEAWMALIENEPELSKLQQALQKAGQQLIEEKPEGLVGSLDFLLENSRRKKGLSESALINALIKSAAFMNRLSLVNNLLNLAASGNEIDDIFFENLDLALISSAVNAAVEGAALGNHAELVNYLIQKGATLNNAATGAACGAHLKLLDDLIRRGASLNSAVKGAAMGNHLKLVNDLLRQEASLNEALKAAAMAGHTELVNDLIRRGGLLKEALWGYAKSGYFAEIDHLTSRCSGLLNSIISGASYGGYFSEVQFILDSSRETGPHYSLLADALRGYARGDYFHQLDELLEQEAEYVSIRNDAVWGAALGGHFALVMYLLVSHEASVNSALTGASIGGHVALLKYLLTWEGASLDTAVWGAAISGQIILVLDLLKKGASLDYAVRGAAFGGQVALVKKLLLRGASLDLAVYGAATGGHTPLIEFLIKQGASINYAVKGANANLGGHFNNEMLALRFLASLPTSLRTAFAEQADHNNFFVHMEPLLVKVDKLMSLAIKRQLSIDQALAFEDPAVQGMLMLARTERFFPRALSLLIVEYLAPFFPREASDLFDKMQLEMRQLDLSLDLNSFHLASSRLGLFRHKRSLKLLKSCKEASSETELDALLQAEFLFLNSKPKEKARPYLTLLKEHAPRL